MVITQHLNTGISRSKHTWEYHIIFAQFLPRAAASPARPIEAELRGAAASQQKGDEWLQLDHNLGYVLLITTTAATTLCRQYQHNITFDRNLASFRIRVRGFITGSQSFFLYKVTCSSVFAQVFLLSPYALSAASVIMPLSSDQVTALKNPDTKITFQDQNPKKGGSNAWGRYEKYKKCVSIGGATAAGANWQDLSSDFEKGYMKFSTTEDVEMSTSTKRAATEGTPDKEAEQRSRVSPSQVAPLVLVPPVVEPRNKVEMSGATIAALRRMMREEVKLGVDDMEQKVAARLDQSLAPLKEQLCEEKEARQKLEERVRILEGKIGNKVAKGEPEDEVDKSVVVLGGFGDKELEEAQDILNHVMAEVDGFKDVHFSNNTPIIALADFESPMKAMKFIRGQRRNAEMQHAQLWASENRSTQERQKCKITSKLKKFMIELAGASPKDVLVNYKSFKVTVRQGGKLCPVAVVGEDMDVQWSNDGMPAVREALDAFCGAGVREGLE